MGLSSLFKQFKARVGATGLKSLLIQPPLLVAPVRFPYGPFQFKAQLAKDISYEVQATTDLRNWISIFTGVSAGEIDYVDSQASKFGHRFYRLNAQGTLSENAVGYATVTVPPGFAMIANPLRAPDNSVTGLFKEMPEGTSFNKFDHQSSRLSENTFTHGKWANPWEKLVSGEGAIMHNPTSDYKSLNFAGEVTQGSFAIPIPAGFSMRSFPLPQPGRLHADLGFPIEEGDVIHLFDRDQQKYVFFPFDAAAWSSRPPIVGVGESFWVAKQSPNNWTGGFSVADGWMGPEASRRLPPTSQLASVLSQWAALTG